MTETGVKSTLQKHDKTIGELESRLEKVHLLLENEVQKTTEHFEEVTSHMGQLTTATEGQTRRFDEILAKMESFRLVDKGNEMDNLEGGSSSGPTRMPLHRHPSHQPGFTPPTPTHYATQPWEDLRNGKAHQSSGSSVSNGLPVTFQSTPPIPAHEPYKVRSTFSSSPFPDFSHSAQHTIPPISSPPYTALPVSLPPLPLPPLLHQYLSSLNYYQDPQPPPAFSSQPQPYYSTITTQPIQNPPPHYYAPNPFTNPSPSGMRFAPPVTHQATFTYPQPYPQYFPREHHNFSPYKFPKVDFPRFEGKDPRGWLSKCDKFFQLNPALKNRQRVMYAALHLDGEADTWYQSNPNGAPGFVMGQFL